MSDEAAKPEPWSKEFYEQQAQILDDEQHKLYAMFAEMPAEHLSKLKLLFESIYVAPTSAPQRAAFWSAWMQAELQRKHNICPACGERHVINDDDLNDLLNGGTEGA